MSEKIPHIKHIAGRIAEMRGLLELTAAELAADIGVTEEQYLRYENAEDDIPIGKLYLIADKLGVDPTLLLTGEAPRMAEYTVVRRGKGVRVERYAGYEFSALAYNYKNREMEPMIVTLRASDTPPEPVVHEGQEFNLVLSGKVAVTIGEREFLLGEGDGIYFNPRLPHGQRAVGVDSEFLTVINERMANKRRDG